MTDEVKTDLISWYNRYVDDMARAENRMDHPNPKISRKADDAFTAALSKQEAFSQCLEILGYELVIDDEDRAVDVVPLDASQPPVPPV